MVLAASIAKFTCLCLTIHENMRHSCSRKILRPPRKLVSVPGERVFLTAEWRYLAMLNYEIDPTVLAPRVPHGTVLDLFQGKALVSVVGFRFLATRVFGVPVPFHRNFEEVNLRFYVRREENGVVKRGVVFIQEIVPRRAISAVARIAYNENYRRLPMGHRFEHANEAGEPRLSVEYWWRLGLRLNRIKVAATGEAHEIDERSAEEFIAEHYWGYAVQRNGASMEYHVSHPRWRACKVVDAELDADVAALYGAEFAGALGRPLVSAFLAEGSPVAVYTGKIITV
jgi:uncharacterized protein